MKKSAISTSSILLIAIFFLAMGSKGGGPFESEDSAESLVSSDTRTLTSSSDPIDNGEVRFSLDGGSWVSGPPGHPEMNFEEEAITDKNTLVRIEAFAADGSHLAITIFNQSGIGVGTFPIEDPGMLGFYTDDFSAGGGYVTNGMDSNPGSVTITTLTDEKVVGTFEFAIRNAGDHEDIRQVTNGSFDLKFTTY